MRCPSCKGIGYCKDSRKATDGTTRRRYVCGGKCKSRWSTIEQLVVVDKGRRRRGKHTYPNLLRRLEAVAREKASANLREELKLVLGMGE
jgi:transcriptional regulator NrdR family protein